MTTDDLTPPHLASGLSHPQPQPAPGPEPLDADPAKGRSEARALVRITRYAVRLVDFDNGAGGCKYLVDAMRYEGLIKDDSPEHIRFEFEQVKVKTKAEEGTEVILEQPVADMAIFE